MARSPRIVVPGQPLHVIQRGNNRSACFAAIHDFAFYKESLYEASIATDCAIHSYVLMGNHAHLLITPSAVHGPGQMMKALGTKYVRYFNDRYGRTGTLREGRYRSRRTRSTRRSHPCSPSDNQHIGRCSPPSWMGICSELSARR
jgi:putative transposase